MAWTLVGHHDVHNVVADLDFQLELIKKILLCPEHPWGQ